MPGPMQRAAYTRITEGGYETPEERAFRLSQQPWADITKAVTPKTDTELIRKAKLAIARRKLAAIKEKERVEEPIATTFPTTTMAEFPEMEQKPLKRLSILTSEPEPWAQKGIEKIGEGAKAFGENVAAFVSSGFTKDIGERRRLNLLRERRQALPLMTLAQEGLPSIPGPTATEIRKAYQETEMPWGVKGALETVPWLAVPAALPVQASLKTAAATATVPKVVRFMARGGAAALEPIAATERIAGAAIGGAAGLAAKPIKRIIEKRRLARLEPIEEAARQTAVEKMTATQARKETAAEARARMVEAYNQETALSPEVRAALAEQEAYGRGALRQEPVEVTAPVKPVEAPKVEPSPVMQPPKPPVKTGVVAPVEEVKTTGVTVYRGGPIKDALSMATDSGYYGEGIYSSSSETAAAVYGKKANASTIPYVLRLKKPFIIDWTTSEAATMTRTLAQNTGVELSGAGMVVQPAKFTEKLKTYGYDGVVVKRPNEPIEYVAFNQRSLIPKVEEMKPIVVKVTRTITPGRSQPPFVAEMMLVNGKYRVHRNSMSLVNQDIDVYGSKAVWVVRDDATEAVIKGGFATKKEAIDYAAKIKPEAPAAAKAVTETPSVFNQKLRDFKNKVKILDGINIGENPESTASWYFRNENEIIIGTKGKTSSQVIGESLHEMGHKVVMEEGTYFPEIMKTNETLAKELDAYKWALDNAGKYGASREDIIGAMPLKWRTNYAKAIEDSLGIKLPNIVEAAKPVTPSQLPFGEAQAKTIKEANIRANLRQGEYSSAPIPLDAKVTRNAEGLYEVYIYIDRNPTSEEIKSLFPIQMTGGIGVSKVKTGWRIEIAYANPQNAEMVKNNIISRIRNKSPLIGLPSGEAAEGAVPKPEVTPAQLPFGEAAKGKGKAPPIKGLGAAPYGADPLQRTMNMWQKVTPNKVPLLEKIGNIEKAIEEFGTDKFALINKMTTRAKKVLGGQIPIEKDAELWLANLSGAPEAGMVKFNEGFAEVNRVLGKGIDLDYVRSYLHLKHAIDIEAALGPQRMIPGGIQGAREARQGLDIMRQQLGQANFARVEAAAEVTRNYYRNMLDNLVNEGLVARETADEWIMKYPWYNQTKIEFELDEAMGGLGRKASVTSSGIKHLTEEGTQQFREDPFATMMRASLQNEVRIAQNRAAKAIIQSGLVDPKTASDIIKVSGVRPVAQVEGETVFRRVPGEIPGTLSYMENGVRQIYEVPKWIEKEAKYLSMLPAASWERIGSAINRASRAGMTGANLAFFIPNFGIDSLTALITEQVGPLRLGSSLARNLIAIVKEDAVLNRMIKAGAGQSGFWGKTPAEVVSAVEKSGNIALNQANWKHLLQNPLKTISEIGHAVEMAPRRAVFEKKLAQGVAEPYAALASRRATIDFQRSGYGIKQANALYLYLNAGIQGSTIPFRALRDSAKARWAVAGFTGALAATYAWNRQFPEYDDIPDYIKYGSVVTMIPSDEYDNRGNKVPHYFTVIPNLREWALFSAPILYVLRKLDQRAPEDVSQFLGSILPQLNPLSQFTGQSGLPVPTQLGETITEIAINKDTFRNRPIVPNELKGLPPAQQYNRYTSLAAKRLGQAINLSPMQIDFFVKGVFGGLGQQVLTAMDLGAKHIYPEYEDPKLISLLGQLKEIKPPSYKPEDVARERSKFLYSLSSENREKLLELERKPVTRLPVISTIANRLYREYGGQMYETGQKISSKLTGVSEEQSEAVSKVLSKANAELQAAQEKADNQLELTGDWRTWIQKHKDSSKYYQGMIMALASEYPISVQALKDPEAVQRYYDSIYTLGLSMPDRRARGQLLIAGWRAIQPEEKPDGEMDWDKFFTERQKYKDALISQDRTLLDEELTATMTKYEKIYYAEQEKLAPYWGIERDVWSKYSPEIKRISDQMDIYEKQDRNKFNAMAYHYPQVIFVKNRIEELKKQYKSIHPEVSAILKRWY